MTKPLLALPLALALAGAAACSKRPEPVPDVARPAPASAETPAPAPAPPPSNPPATAEGKARFETPRAVFETPRGEVSVVVEVADTPALRAQGLMWRETLPQGTGMVFVFEKSKVQSFWMKNTLLPLDMIFVDGEPGGPLEVVGLVTDTEPLSETPRSVGVPSRYVIEVPNGYSFAHGIATGTKVRLVDMP